MVYCHLVNELLTWLNTEIGNRGWSNNELARRAGMSSAGLSKVMTGRNAITWDFCYRVAQALKEPPEKIFRLAGLLPPAASERDQLIQELLEIARKLDATDRDELLAYARLRYQRAQER